MTEETEKRKQDRSIHPRNWPGASFRDKQNTSKPRNKDRVLSVIAAIEKHLERHPTDGMSVARVAKLKSSL